MNTDHTLQKLERENACKVQEKNQTGLQQNSSVQTFNTPDMKKPDTTIVISGMLSNVLFYH